MLFYMSEEDQEGRDAFKEKRKPNFKKYPNLPKFFMKIKSWLIAARLNTLIFSIAPVLLGIAFSIEKNQFSSFLVGFLTLLASILIQLGTNFINDLYDFLSGADDINRLGPQRAVQSGILTTNQMKLGAYLCFLLALIIGFIWCCWRFTNINNW